MTEPLGQIVQSGCGVALTGDIPEPSGHNPQSCATSTGEVGPVTRCGPFQPDHSMIVNCCPWSLTEPQLAPVLPEREEMLPCTCCPHLSPWQPLPLQVLQSGGLSPLHCPALPEGSPGRQPPAWAGVHRCSPAALSGVHEGISGAKRYHRSHSRSSESPGLC